MGRLSILSDGSDELGTRDESIGSSLELGLVLNLQQLRLDKVVAKK